MTEKQMKREIMSYGIISIPIEEESFPCIDLDQSFTASRL